MATIGAALTVADTVGDGGTVRWDRDAQDLRDVTAAWYELGAPSGVVRVTREEEEDITIGDILDQVDGMVAAGEYSGDLEAALGITIKPADDDDEDVDL
mgnify:CR=1 FL=1